MKYLLLAMSLTFAQFSIAADTAPAKTKKVCHMVKANDGKMKEQCKTIKIHKKLEGTDVPAPTKKK